ncbi:putative choline sulfate-utilization transcription factor [Sphaerotilus hippei]|uniref:Putative choline sulfate-utilization transcription factor n=1 Tax=Sphaerotilus hippei TaxID=744406 RepID=A0A318GX46_9BURK|nr:LysR substrate-binding domain-containing protein [Sphaerotilus hippei]PXW94345.1 putative choline sulfate-utilization transcription factor [Sphaerotilus hippei]
MANQRRLPPLQSLVFFEAAARHLSFTTAARELGSSQPAVSQRIGLLEEDLGLPLFRREHRGVSLTADGAFLFEAVHASLGGLGEAVNRLRARHDRQVLTVVTDFGFATYWLMPRLAALRASIPNIDVRIVTSQNEFDIRGEPVDVAIAFGSGSWPGCQAERLFPEVVVPVCSPAFLARHGLEGEPAALGGLPLLHLESAEPARWLTWSHWFALHGLTTAAERRDLTLNNYALVIQAAIAGQGVALAWLPLVDELIRSGQLVTAVTRPVRTERGYFLVQPHALRSSGLLAGFRQWMLDECATAG